MSAPLGEPSLHSAPFRQAWEALASGLANVGHPLPQAVVEALARRCIREYVKHTRTTIVAHPNHHISPETTVLTEMQMGETREFPPADPSVYRSRMKTARKLMENPAATWRVLRQSVGNAILIERLWDGDKTYKPRSQNIKIQLLVGMKVGESIITNLFRNKIESWYKNSARRELGIDNANWRCLNLANGNVKCERIR